MTIDSKRIWIEKGYEIFAISGLGDSFNELATGPWLSSPFRLEKMSVKREEEYKTALFIVIGS